MSVKPKPNGAVKPKTVARPAQAATPALPGAAPLLSDLRGLILSARQQVAQAVNSGLTMLCWHIGSRIRKNILKENRAEYGQEILQSLSAKLAAAFGRGYSARNLANMVRFAEAFPGQAHFAIADCNIGMDSFSAPYLPRRSAETRFLR